MNGFKIMDLGLLKMKDKKVICNHKRKIDDIKVLIDVKL